MACRPLSSPAAFLTPHLIACLSVSAAIALAPNRSQAQVLTVSAPDVRPGEVRIASGAAFDSEGGEKVLDLSFGVTDRWRTGVEFVAEQALDEPLRYVATTWENTFLIVNQRPGIAGSAGLRFDYDFARASDSADAISARLLLQRRTARFDLRLNLGVKREVGAGADSDIGGDLRVSVRHRWRQGLTPALDYLGSVSRLQSPRGFEQQGHRLGPVLYGELGQGLRYEVGYLAGLSAAAPNHTFKLGLEYRVELHDRR